MMFGPRTVLKMSLRCQRCGRRKIYTAEFAIHNLAFDAWREETRSTGWDGFTLTTHEAYSRGLRHRYIDIRQQKLRWATTLPVTVEAVQWCAEPLLEQAAELVAERCRGGAPFAQG